MQGQVTQFATPSNDAETSVPLCAGFVVLNLVNLLLSLVVLVLVIIASGAA